MSQSAKTKLTCEQCGGVFFRSQGYMNSAEKTDRPAKFCSRRCRYDSQRTQVSLVCEECGASFLRHRSEVSKAQRRGFGKHIYCSSHCANVKRSAGNRECTCEHCGKAFAVWASVFIHAAKEGHGAGRFCSTTCRDAFMAIARQTAVMVSCATCGKLHRRIPANLREHNFCSQKCMGAMVPTWTRQNHYFGVGGVQIDLGRYFRSRWEANFARVLSAMGLAWEYESTAFACGDTFYTPDFRIGNSYWVEVKGYLTDTARQKIETFRALYPEETLVIVDRPIYRAMQREWEPRIPEWEHSAV